MDAPTSGIASNGQVSETPEPSAEPGGGVRAMLIGTTDENRNHIMWRTIIDAGFECEAARTSRMVGDDGSSWRVNCGNAQTYWMDVDEFGRLLVAPMPYGDIDGSVVPVEVVPRENLDQGGRTLELRSPE